MSPSTSRPVYSLLNLQANPEVPSSPLFQLPPELRNQIYGYVLLDPAFERNEIVKERDKDTAIEIRRNAVGLLRVCKLINAEASPFLWRDSCFVVKLSPEEYFRQVHGPDVVSSLLRQESIAHMVDWEIKISFGAPPWELLSARDPFSEAHREALTKYRVDARKYYPGFQAWLRTLCLVLLEGKAQLERVVVTIEHGYLLPLEESDPAHLHEFDLLAPLRDLRVWGTVEIGGFLTTCHRPRCQRSTRAYVDRLVAQMTVQERPDQHSDAAFLAKKRAMWREIVQFRNCMQAVLESPAALASKDDDDNEEEDDDRRRRLQQQMADLNNTFNLDTAPDPEHPNAVFLHSFNFELCVQLLEGPYSTITKPRRKAADNSETEGGDWASEANYYDTAEPDAAAPDAVRRVFETREWFTRRREFRAWWPVVVTDPTMDFRREWEWKGNGEVVVEPWCAEPEW